MKSPRKYGQMLARKLPIRMKLRTKLAIWLAIAGLVPLVAVSTFSLKNATDRLHDTIHEATQRSLRIAMNLVLRQVQQTAADASRLALASDIQRLFQHDPQAAGVNRARPLSAYQGHIVPALVELVDKQGRLVAKADLGDESLENTVDQSLVIRLAEKGLDYEHDVNIVDIGGIVAIEAVAPVINEDFDLLGAIILILPLDGHMAEQLRATLGVDVVFYRRNDNSRFTPIASSMLDPKGRKFKGMKLSAKLLGRLTRHRISFGTEELFGRSFSVGILPLMSAGAVKEDLSRPSRSIVGLLAVAVDRESLVQSRSQTIRATLVLAFMVLAIALAVSMLAARSLTKPLARLHSGALDVAKGNLDLSIPVDTSDEIGELAQAFNQMTEALQQNRRQLAARISEMIILHVVGRAVSAVIDIEEVLETAVSEVERALGADGVVVYLVDEEENLWLSAISGLAEEAMDAWEGPAGKRLASLAFDLDEPETCADLEKGTSDIAAAARSLGLTGSILLVPFRQKQQMVGCMVVLRLPPNQPLGRSESRLLGLLSDQIGTAVVNARLYEEVTTFSERLEEMVAQRTEALRQANEELAETLENLQQTQAQLVLSERLAGMGSLVAGIAHEVNTPTGAIQGASENLDRQMANITAILTQLPRLHLPAEAWQALLQAIRALVENDPQRAQSTSTIEHAAHILERQLSDMDLPNARFISNRLAEMGLVGAAQAIIRAAGDQAGPLLQILVTAASFRRNLFAIKEAIRSISRIVRALRSYSHLDQTKIDRADIHDGIETTLVILANRLKYNITIKKHYGRVPPLPCYVDELNQVWTNLLVNAADAIQQGRGKGVITIETDVEDDHAVVRIIDDGPGIPEEKLPEIFRPFYTTKPKGSGTGLGLGIVQQIVAKHGGRIEAESQPGRTCFSVYLPLAGPEDNHEDQDAPDHPKDPANSKDPADPNGPEAGDSSQPPSDAHSAPR